MTTALSTLKQRLQTMIGDDSGTLAHRYTDAINNASRDLYTLAPLFKRLLDDTLIGNNILPPFHWTSSSTLDFYTEPTGTLAETTTAGYYRHASGSAKVTADGADDSIVLDSNNYPRLLDLMDTTVNLRCWAMPEDANDAKLDIVTTDADGDDTTESSTTACPAGVFTLLKIEDYDVPDDITRIRINLRTHTDKKYAYFDPPRLTGKTVYQYVLPYDFQNGVVSQVHLQSSSYSDDACDDLHPRYGTPSFGWLTPTDGDGYKYLDFTNASPKPLSKHRIQLLGYCPLEDDLDDDDDTISLDNPMHINILLRYAASLIYDMEAGIVSGQSRERYEGESNKWLSRAMYLIDQGGAMTEPQGQIHWSI
jgi:hypothetical protein